MADSAPSTLSAAPDPELEAALKKVLKVVLQEHGLTSNQLLTVASELQRLGVHKLVEEHLRKFEGRQRAGG